MTVLLNTMLHFQRYCLQKLCQFFIETMSRGYKTFFMLNSIEHEILNAHKYKNIKKIGFL